MCFVYICIGFRIWEEFVDERNFVDLFADVRLDVSVFVAR
jgi:hypothetical protein